MESVTDERLVSFESGGEQLHGVLHLPGEEVERALVFCHPFAEEKKCAHRTMVEAARACAESGWAVLRFDQRGCGDSGGSFDAYAPEDWRLDIEAALDCAEAETGAPVGLLGLRLGASLAAEVVERRPGVDCLVLWEPIIEGGRYIAQNLRRSMIKAKMTAHEGGEESGGDASGAREAGKDAVDFDGYRVPARMREQIEHIDLLRGGRSFAQPVLVLGIGPRDGVDEVLQRLAAAYAHGSALAVRQEPFWQRIGMIDAGAALDATVDWLTDLTEDRLRQL